MKDHLVAEILKDFKLNKTQLQQIYNSYLNQIKLGLNKKTQAIADTKCFITYVQELPSGDELGKFLALDLGGTNFRVLLVTLKGHHEAEVQAQVYALAEHIRLGSGEQLFDHIADCLSRFVHENKLNDLHLPLGFTFSFPCTQIGLKHAKLRRWTKGFNCANVVDKDVVQMLKEAIQRHGGLNIDCVGILNDTTGTLISCAHRNPMCRIGAIVGTGSNVCYVERVENIDMPIELKSKPFMLINTECGAFGDGGSLDFIRTEFDEEVDKLTPNIGTQIFEKMISGMYLGEIVRFIFLKFMKANAIFENCENRALIQNYMEKTRDCFETKHISEIESDEAPKYKKTRDILNEVFGLTEVSLEDCKRVQYACECVSRRAAALFATAVSVLINKVDEKKVVVGMDGSVYRFHPKFDGYMRETLNELVKKGIKYELMLSEDGSGRGAALVAAVATKSVTPRI